MTDTINTSGTLSRTRRPSDTLHPHYFNSFQNYCTGPKARTITSASSSKDYLPIPEQFQKRAGEILDVYNRILIDRISHITQLTSVLPREFFEQDRSIDHQKYLIDRGMFKTMTDAKVINWVPSLKKLYPVRTSGNGNCLLHAVLISMIGVHDFDLNLRDRLRQYMTTNTEKLKKSWKIERVKTDKMYGIQSEESKFDSEWEELCDLVRYDNTEDGQAASSFQFLEAVHIFALSNMLARPIIILSEEVVRNKHGEAISYNDLFGIYLPTLLKAKDRVAYPIVLVYDQSHFCPLQSNNLDMKSNSDNFLPLYQSSEYVHKQTLLPIRFLGTDESPTNADALLKHYLRIKTLAYFPESHPPAVHILCAELCTKHPRDQDNFFLVYYEYLKNFFEPQKKRQQEEEDEKRRYEQDNHSTNQPLHETIQRVSRKTDHSSPPPYSSVVTRSSDVQKPTIIERRPSYGEAVNNGAAYVSSTNPTRPTNQHFEQQKSPINSSSPDNHQNNNRHYQLSNWELVDNGTTSNGKPTNYSTTNPRTSDSKLKQEFPQSTSVRVPVRFDKNDSSTNLIDFDQRTDQIRQCLLCQRMFNDLASTKICSECDRQKKPSLPPRQPVSKQSAPIIISPSTDLVDFAQETDQLRPCFRCKRLFNDISSTKFCNDCIQQTNPSPVHRVTIRRAPPSNNFGNPYGTSDFLTPKVQSPLKLNCPQCKTLNQLNHVEKGMVYYCSRCRQVLHMGHY